MERQAISPRKDWRAKFEAFGFSFHSADGGYWDETACYRFASDEVDRIEAATEELHRLCLAAVEHVVEHGRYSELDVPSWFAPSIERSWSGRQSSLYGRMDLCYDGSRPPVLLEYNADTPTSVLEAAVAQWHWLEETHHPDQFNSLHEQLIDRWRVIGGELPIGPLYCSCLKDSNEDRVTTEYLRDTALQAGLDARFICIEDVGWNGEHFLDEENRPITAWFKLYPWEWMLREPFGRNLTEVSTGLRVVEPAWKALLSNKGILAILWELFPGHPNLLPAYFEPSALGDRYVAKPLFSREGANVEWRDGPVNLTTAGPYGDGRRVYQALQSLPAFDGRYPVIGSWVVGDRAAGMGIREDAQPITTDRSRFVPHYFS